MSLVVTTNLPFENWTEVLGSEHLTGATLDRLTHRCHILEAAAESYRLQDAKRSRRMRNRMCRELYDHRAWLWTFLDVEGVEPTNNAAERSLRHAVICRKLSFGTQSADGSRFVETLLSIIETCRQHNRNVFEYITQTVTARFHHRKCPSIIGRV